MIKRYVKKPIVIEAMQFDSSRACYDELLKFMPTGQKAYKFQYGDVFWLEIGTLEGVMRVHERDYIVKGIAGEVYPVNRNIFEQSYEEVEE